MMHILDTWPLWKYLVAISLIIVSALTITFIAHFKDIMRDVSYWLDRRFPEAEDRHKGGEL